MLHEPLKGVLNEHDFSHFGSRSPFSKICSRGLEEKHGSVIVMIS